MTSPILFAGGEDLSFTPIGSGILSAASSVFVGSWGVDTTANSFRSGYGRYSLAQNGGIAVVLTSSYLRTIPLNGSAFSSSSFWVSFRCNVKGGNANQTGAYIPVRFVDSAGVVRLRIKFSNVNTPPNDTFIVEKLNSAGTNTQIGSTSTGRYMSFIASGSYSTVPDKIDIFVNYAASGTFTVYTNGVQTFTFSGDVTTDSQTALAAVDLGASVGSVNSTNPFTNYSEVIVSTRDTRNMSLLTQAPTANGNTHNWDGGTAANASANFAGTGQISPQYATSSGLIQQYQITPAVPTGTFGVISVVQHAQATIGLSGPTKFDFMVRSGATDYTSSDISPTAAWATYVNNWDTNPNTTVAWLTTDLPASSTSFNMGLKSVT